MATFFAGLVTGSILTLALVRIVEWISILVPWRRAMMSGAKVSVVSILRMKMKGCPAAFLVDAFAALVHSGKEVDIQQVEACYIARKHEIREDDMGAFLKMAEEFIAEPSGQEGDA